MWNGDSKKECSNCINGWIPIEVPQDTARDSEHGEIVYGEDYAGKFLQYATPCPICNGGEAHAEYIRERANIPSSFYDVNMDGFKWDSYEDETGRVLNMSMPQKMVRSFVQQFKEEWKPAGMGLYIYSRTTGSGKSYLASAICNSMIKLYHCKTKFVNVASLIDISKTEGGINELIQCDLLVLDDLGQKAAGVSWVGDIIYQILEERKKKVTLATSNLNIGELQFDSRIISRVNDAMQLLRMPEIDLRAKEANRKKRGMLERLGIVKESDENQQQKIELE